MSDPTPFAASAQPPTSHAPPSAPAAPPVAPAFAPAPDAAAAAAPPAFTPPPQAAAPAPAPAAGSGFPRPSAAHDHAKILGWIYVFWGAVWTVVAAVYMLILALTGTLIGGVTSRPGGWDSGGALLVGMGMMILGLAVCAVPACWAGIGWGLMKRRPWARFVALGLALIELAVFPLGTLMGAYALWVLFDERIAAEFR